MEESFEASIKQDDGVRCDETEPGASLATRTRPDRMFSLQAQTDQTWCDLCTPLDNLSATMRPRFSQPNGSVLRRHDDQDGTPHFESLMMSGFVGACACICVAVCPAISLNGDNNIAHWHGLYVLFRISVSWHRAAGSPLCCTATRLSFYYIGLAALHGVESTATRFFPTKLFSLLEF